MATNPDVVAVVHMSGGRWVARCPRPTCPNGECFGKCDDGTTGGLTADGLFHCRNEFSPSGVQYDGCGLTCRAQWPAADLVPQIEALLRPRPPYARNWQPAESLADLQHQNAVMGIVPETVLAGRPAVILGNDAPAAALGTTTRLEIGS